MIFNILREMEDFSISELFTDVIDLGPMLMIISVHSLYSVQFFKLVGHDILVPPDRTTYIYK